MKLEFDFELLNSDFKEDSVRELIIAPILKEIGFRSGKNRLEMQLSPRKKANIQLGSNEILQKDFVPDYILLVDSKMHCVLDAKGPNQSIEPDSRALKQVASYNLEFKASFLGLCNGRKMIIYESGRQKIVLEMDLKNDLEAKFEALREILTDSILASNAFTTPPHLGLIA